MDFDVPFIQHIRAMQKQFHSVHAERNVELGMMFRHIDCQLVGGKNSPLSQMITQDSIFKLWRKYGDHLGASLYRATLFNMSTAKSTVDQTYVWPIDTILLNEHIFLENENLVGNMRHLNSLNRN